MTDAALHSSLRRPWGRAVGPPEAEITGIAYDSRAVRRGDLFVALPGVHVDGHRFIKAAVARGAAAVLCQHDAGRRTAPYRTSWSR